MATLTKSGARAPLAAGTAMVSWGRSGNQPGQYKIAVRNDDTDKLFTLSLPEPAAIKFVDWVASHETFDHGCGTVDRRTLPQKLRALADKLEAAGELNRMELTG